MKCIHCEKNKIDKKRTRTKYVRDGNVLTRTMFSSKRICSECRKFPRCKLCTSILSPYSLFKHNGKVCEPCQSFSFDNIRSYCLICLKDLEVSKKRFLKTGNYCLKCHGNPKKAVESLEGDILLI